MDISVWGKLFKKQLFDGIEFPNGKKFEEPATIYKVIEKAKKIVCGGDANYYYQIRPYSITTHSSFYGKMDLIKHTEQMCNYIKEKYPNLENEANKRLIWANFSTLKQLLISCDSNNFHNEKKAIIDFIKSKTLTILKGNYSINDKISSIAIFIGVYPIIYQIIKKYSK